MSHTTIYIEYDVIKDSIATNSVYGTTLIIHPEVKVICQGKIFQFTGVQNAGVLQIDNAEWTGIEKDEDDTTIAKSNTLGIHGLNENGTLHRGKIIRSKIDFQPEKPVEITDHTLDLKWTGTEPTFRNVTFINRPTIQKSTSIKENCVCAERLITESLSNLSNATNLRIDGPLASSSNNFISFN